MSKPKLVYAVERRQFKNIFSEGAQRRIASHCDVLGSAPEAADKDFLLDRARDVEILVTGWGTARIDADVVAAAPRLKLVLYSAGSVKVLVSDAMWDRGIRVVSSAPALGISVAEFTLGLILTVPKRTHWVVDQIRQGKWDRPGDLFGPAFELNGQKVGIIGASYIGRHLIKLLRPFDCRVLLYDPYCPPEEAKAMGASKVDTLDEIFSQCRVVSLHAPITDETTGMIRGRHFAMLPDGAVFINSARGVIINEQEMIEELRKGRFVACLDVTWPEPPPVDSELRRLPNVMLTPHMSGAIAEDLTRLGDFVASQISAYLRGKPLKGEVLRDCLALIA